MKLGEYELKRPVFMAPMAGVTDKAFREMIVLAGGQYTFTEMISDKALLYHNTKTLQMLDLSAEPEPKIVQIFGSESEPMAKAAKLVVKQGADVIDINMGCPTPKIVKNGEGSALLRNPDLAVSIAAAVVEAVEIPVTVKLRLGWDDQSIVAPQLAPRLEKVGVSMITLHARTREQFYNGQADWSWFPRVREKLTIPLIGNGDILSPQDAERMIQQYGTDGVMIARGALGNPWLLGRTQKYLLTGILEPEPQPEERLRMVQEHLRRLLLYKGEKIGVKEMRKHAAWYLKGRRKAAEHRNELMTCTAAGEMEKILAKAFCR